MNDIWIFVLGAIIFGGYMFGLLSMINKQHKIQAREQDRYMKSQDKKAS
ncbi:MAG: hypothetical protein IPO90_11780 [Flavobacteriales bacterium]|nr:hypothetical protein [Flavobacteriales bacterium]